MSSSQVSANNGWGAVAAQFGLPDEIPQPNGTSISAAQALSQYYLMLLLPFEHFYRQNTQDQQKRGQVLRQGQQHPVAQPNQSRPIQTISSGSQSGQMSRGIIGGSMGSMNQVSGGSHTTLSTMNGTSQPPQPLTPQTPQRPGSTALNQPAHGTPHTISGMSLLDTITNGQIGEGNVLDQETQGIKRKMDFDQGDKRARQKTGQFPTSLSPESARSNHCFQGQNPRKMLQCVDLIYLLCIGR
jgi:SWI/SNF chromatin-remodeling complex subunit SWI1